MLGEIEIREDVERAKKLSAYEAVDVLWVALIKAANLCDGQNELARLTNLVAKFDARALSTILESPAVDQLLALDPPLETVLHDRYECLQPIETMQAINAIRKNRKLAPHEAVLRLGSILKRIRNKRAHGFKSSEGPRDQEILSAARSILANLCSLLATLNIIEC